MEMILHSQLSLNLAHKKFGEAFFAAGETISLTAQTL